jgi:Cupredoxin-like domain
MASILLSEPEPIAMSIAFRKLTFTRLFSAVIAASVSIFMAAGAVQTSDAADASISSGKPAASTDRHATIDVMPTFKLVVGAKGSPDPYTPRVLNIPAGKKIAVDVTDNIGGCALVTIFPDLGPDGATVRASVPVGQTRRVVLLAAKPGRYRYHCSENMFFGEIVAQ